MIDDPFEEMCYRRLIDVKRPYTSAVASDLHDRVLTEGHLPIADLTPEERAMAHVLAARGVLARSGDAYVAAVVE